MRNDIKTNWNNAIYSNMNGPRDYYTKWSKSGKKDNYHMYHVYVESEIWHKGTYWQNRNRLIELENKFMVTKGERGGG